MTEIKLIRTEDEYLSSLEEIEQLILTGSQSPDEADRLELLTIITEAYERSKYPIEPQDPIDAIRFRMEEKGLKQSDLIPYFGTSGRVSEILNRKRPLTVEMIRAVSLGLGISADTLLGLAQPGPDSAKAIVDWSKFPIREMMRRGWIEGIVRPSREAIAQLVQQYVSDAGLPLGSAAFRRTLSGNADSPTTQYSLYAWLARVIQRARAKKGKLGRFEQSRLSTGFLRELAQLSWSEKGPLLAVEYLNNHGICVIIEPHLKSTRLDGAALRDIDGTPIIGLTLRFDRLDSFWFTLLHEAVHIWKHVGDAVDTFLDDLDANSEDRREAEANRLAREAFIPRILWRRSDAFLRPSRESIYRFARELKISPAVIVGQLHRDTGDYRTFQELLGRGQVKQMIPSGE